MVEKLCAVCLWANILHLAPLNIFQDLTMCLCFHFIAIFLRENFAYIVFRNNKVYKKKPALKFFARANYFEDQRFNVRFLV